METEAPPSQGRRHRSAVPALRSQLHAIARTFSTPTGRHIAAMLAASDQDSELAKAFRNHFVLARREEGKARLAQADASATAAGRNLDVVADLLHGPVFFRLMLGHAPLDAAFIDALVREVLARGVSGR